MADWGDDDLPANKRPRAQAEPGWGDDDLKPEGKGSISQPYDLSRGQRRKGVIPIGSYYKDKEGNIRRNDNGDAGNPIIFDPRGRPYKADGRAKGGLRGLVRGDSGPRRGDGASLLDEIGGGLSSVVDTIPFADEAQAALATVESGLRGQIRPRYKQGENPLSGMSTLRGVGDSFEGNLKAITGFNDDFTTRRPVVSGTIKNAALAGTVFVPGGAATQVATAPTRAAMAARGAGMGALQGGVFGLGGRGSLEDRTRDAEVGAAIGGTLGGVLGAATGGRPRAQKPRRIDGPAGRVLRGQDAAAMRARQAEYQAAGIRPAPIDVIDDSGRGVVRATASRMTPARQATTDFVDARAMDLPDRMGRQARDIVSNDARNPVAISEKEAADFADEFGKIRSEIGGGVGRGDGGRAISASLNKRFDAAKGDVDAAYGVAREARPDQAMVPRSERAVSLSNIRDAMSDYDMAGVPRVASQLGSLDNIYTMSARDLFDARSRLSKLRVSNDGVEAAAAGRAVRAIDDEMDRLVNGGALTGDPAVVGLWKEAIGKRREFGKQFEGDDLINRLTERVNRGGERTLAVAPEDASAIILGRQSVRGGQDLVRDLTRLKGVLEPDAWNSLRGEVIGRLGGKDGAEIAKAWPKISKTEPDLINALLSPAEQARIEAFVARANGPRPSDVGSRFLNGNGDEFARDVLSLDASGVASAKAVARREIERSAGTNVASAPGVARKLSSAPEQQLRNRALLGPDADRLQTNMGLEARLVRNANDIAPRGGSQTALRNQDAENVGNALSAVGKVARGDFVGLAMDRLKTIGVDDKAAQELTELAIDQNRTEELIRLLEGTAAQRNPSQARALVNDILRDLRSRTPRAAAAGSSELSRQADQPTPRNALSRVQ